MKIADAVRDLGGSRTPVSKRLLAQRLKYAESGPSFFQRVGAAKSFGIIEGWGSYSLTDNGKKYFYPSTASEKNSAAIAFLSAPTAFALLVKRFDGDRLPTNDMVGNILHNEAKIPDSWKDRLASIFMRSAQFIGVLDSSGCLRCQALLDGTPADGDKDIDKDKDKNKNDPPPPLGDKVKNDKEPEVESGFIALPISINARTGSRAILHFQKQITNEEVGKLIDSIKLSFDYKNPKDADLRNPQGKEDSQ